MNKRIKIFWFLRCIRHSEGISRGGYLNLEKEVFKDMSVDEVFTIYYDLSVDKYEIRTIYILWRGIMKGILISGILCLSLGILFYILWINGYMVVNMKRAILMVGSMGRSNNKCRANFLSCSAD